jgi:hypothetical protein
LLRTFILSGYIHLATVMAGLPVYWNFTYCYAPVCLILPRIFFPIITMKREANITGNFKT